MAETITSRGAREAKLSAMRIDDLWWKGKQHELSDLPGVHDLKNATIRGRLIQRILDAEFGTISKCACGDPTALYTVHRPDEDGPCFLYEPSLPEDIPPLYSGKIEGNKIVQSWGDPVTESDEPAPARVVTDGPIVTHFKIQTGQVQTESGRYILQKILPRVIEYFLSKNADYGDQHRFGLGPRAEFVGMHRKMYKLRKVLWDGEEMNHEGAEEMIMDLIGSGLLILDLFDQEGT